MWLSGAVALLLALQEAGLIPQGKRPFAPDGTRETVPGSECGPLP